MWKQHCQEILKWNNDLYALDSLQTKIYIEIFLILFIFLKKFLRTGKLKGLDMIEISTLSDA